MYQFEISGIAWFVLPPALAGGMIAEQLKALAKLHWAKAHLKLFYHQFPALKRSAINQRGTKR